MVPPTNLLSLADAPPPAPASTDSTDDSARRIGLSWLVTVRWTTLLAVGGVMAAGRSGLAPGAPVDLALTLIGALGVSNVWLMWRIRRGRARTTLGLAAFLVCADVVALTVLLRESGGVLNPASVFYLVQIVMTALVLGRRWTWVVTMLSVLGYAALFLSPTSALDAAQVMHPEIGVHMRGMWVAFALTAMVIGVLVTRLAIAIERRDRALDVLRDRTARATQAAGLATLATGAAHDLSTPLATMAVAARELERALSSRPDATSLHDDARLIRTEIDRCRGILNDMAHQGGEPLGEAPQTTTVAEILNVVRARLSPADARRVRLQTSGSITVMWPVEVVVRALLNLTRNGLQASTEYANVELDAVMPDERHVRVSVLDHGSGMSPDHLARAGEPFFTTKAPGLGTGLGLFVARSSIEQLGGTLTLASVPGHGTTAVIVLPRDVVAAGD
jgi:two-component system sensor histidine kinase RegB